MEPMETDALDSYEVGFQTTCRIHMTRMVAKEHQDKLCKMIAAIVALHIDSDKES